MTITVYTTPTCGYCHQVKRYLSDRGFSYNERDVSIDREAAEEMVRTTGQMGVPVIAIGSDVVVGFDRNKLEQLLSRYQNQEKPHFGLRVADADKTAVKFGIEPVPGALIGSIAQSSIALKAGLQEKDIIIEINGSPVRNVDDLQRLLSAAARGDRLSITFFRGSEKRQTVLLV